MNQPASITHHECSGLPESVMIVIRADRNGIPQNAQLQEAVRSTASKIYETVNRHKHNARNFKIRFNGYHISDVTWEDSTHEIFSERILAPGRIPENGSCKSNYQTLLQHALKALGFIPTSNSKKEFILK